MATKKPKNTCASAISSLDRFVGTPVENYFPEIQKQFAPDLYRRTSGLVIGGETKYISWDIDIPKVDAIELLQITDVQYGHVGCKEERIIEYRDWILKAPNRFMLWTGDMIDAGSKLSKGDSTIDQRGLPLHQVLEFCRLMAPARHRVLGYVGGNHERRPAPMFGDLGGLIAAILGLPYSGGRQEVDIYFGEHKPFKATLWHGVGGARTKGTVAQILHRLVQQGDSELYLMGHVHQPLVMPIWKETRNLKTRRMQKQKCIGAVGSSFMETIGTYGEVAGYAPHDVMMAKATIEADGKWMVTLK